MIDILSGATKEKRSSRLLKRNVLFIFTGPPERIISSAKIVSQLCCTLHRREPCLAGLIKDPTFVTVVVLVVVIDDIAVGRHPADFIFVASTEGFRKPARLPRLQC